MAITNEPTMEHDDEVAALLDEATDLQSEEGELSPPRIRSPGQWVNTPSIAGGAMTR